MDYTASVTLKWLVHRKSLLHSQHIKLVYAPDASSDAISDISDRHVLPFSDRKLLTLPYLHALFRRGWLAICQVWSCIGLASVRLSRLFLTLCSSIRHILKVARQRAACGWSRTRGMRVDTNLFSSWAGVTRELLASSSTPRDVKHAPYNVR